MNGHVRSAAWPLARRGAKNVLMIDYFFPPAGGAGHRTLWFAKYLGQFGWDPIVLTVQAGDHNFVDLSLLEKIPSSVDVQRTSSVEPLRFARRIFAREAGEGHRYGSELRSGARAFAPVIRRMRKLEHWVFFPDRHIGWLPFAVMRALHINRHRRIDLVYSSSTAVTSHLIALHIKKLLGTPWVADFQDPWAEGSVAPIFPSSIHSSLARYLEGLILRSADHVTVTAAPLQRAFERRTYETPPGKVTVVPCGYDPTLFERVQAAPRPQFTMIHFGSLYAGRSPEPFLEALGQCVQEHPDLSKELDVLFVGALDPALRTSAANAVDRWGLRGVVRFDGAVSHPIGLQLLMSCDVLLLIADSGPWARNTIPGKLYEYLAARRPILALLPDGPASDILRAANAGLIVPPDDVPAIRNAIWTFHQRGREGRLVFAANQPVIERYAWSRLTGELASLFDTVLCRRGSPPLRGALQHRSCPAPPSR